jgi:hypothetical protein
MKRLLCLALLCAAVLFGQDPAPSPYAPYAEPIAVTICQIDPLNNNLPAIDEATGQPRCFQITQPVSRAVTLWMLTQKEPGTDADGKPVLKLKYVSWWDWVVKEYASLVMPKLDLFPPPEVVSAKEQADAAVKAVDAAKATVLGVAPQQ